MRTVSLILQCAFYCVKKRMPLVKTFRHLWNLKREQNAGIPFLLTVDYLNNEKKDSFYLAEDFMIKCCRLNRANIRDLFDDKTVLYNRCPELLGRECLIIKEHSDEEILEFIRKQKKIVGKRNYGSKGERFGVYTVEEGTPEQILIAIKEHKQVLLEGYIEQHSELAKLHPQSLNTMRIHTVNNGREIRSFFAPKLRIGCDGSLTDMVGKKGSYRAILRMDGTVEMSARIDATEMVKKATIHHNSNIRFDEIRVPYVKEAVDLAIRAAQKFPEVPYIGWDIAIAPTGPVVVEGNTFSGCFATYQMINYLYYGCGLRKEMDEMLDYGFSSLSVQEEK